MKAIIREIDSSVVDGKIFSREVENATIDDEKGLIYVCEPQYPKKILEVINMTSRNFHSVLFDYQ